jgi:deoxyribodipyrimidine photo-lyase
MAKALIQVVWFKRDMRIHDHAPLSNAAAAGPVLPLIHLSTLPRYWQHWECHCAFGKAIPRNC